MKELITIVVVAVVVFGGWFAYKNKDSLKDNTVDWTDALDLFTWWD